MDSEIIMEAYIKKSANTFKRIIELLAQTAPIKKCNILNASIKQIYFKITKDNINININNDDINLDIVLNTKSFCSYKFAYKYPNLSIGINSNIIKTFFKNSSKTEGVLLRIQKDVDQICPSNIEINICSEDNKYIRGTTINFNILQNKLNVEPLNMVSLAIIPGDKFSSICKEMGSTKSLIKVIAKDHKLAFSKNEADMAKNWLTFNIFSDIEFVEYLKAEYIKSISKLYSFDSVLSINKGDNVIAFNTHIAKCCNKNKQFDYIGYINVNIKTDNPTKDDFD